MLASIATLQQLPQLIAKHDRPYSLLSNQSLKSSTELKWRNDDLAVFSKQRVRGDSLVGEEGEPIASNYPQGGDRVKI
jgi:hypothetical protein